MAENSVSDISPGAWVFFSISISLLILLPWARKQCEKRRKKNEQSKKKDFIKSRKQKQEAPYSSLEYEYIDVVGKEPVIKSLETQDKEIEMFLCPEDDSEDYPLIVKPEKPVRSRRRPKKVMCAAEEPEVEPYIKPKTQRAPPPKTEIKRVPIPIPPNETLEQKVERLVKELNFRIDDELIRINDRFKFEEWKFDNKLEKLEDKMEKHVEKAIEKVKREIMSEVEELIAKEREARQEAIRYLKHKLQEEIKDANEKLFVKITDWATEQINGVIKLVNMNKLKIKMVKQISTKNEHQLEVHSGLFLEMRNEIKDLKQELKRFEKEEEKRWEEEERRRNEPNCLQKRLIAFEKLFETPPALVEKIWMDLESFFYSLAWLYSRCMLMIIPLWYCFTTLTAFFIILPTCYILLVLGFNKIEKDSEHVQRRGKQLDQESTLDRMRRNMTIVFISLAANVFLIGYPQLMIRVLKKNRIVAILVYVGVILIVQIFGTYRTYVSTYLCKHEVTVHNSLDYGKAHTYLKMMGLTYECIQISYYAYFYALSQNHDDASEFPSWVINLLLIRISPGDKSAVDFYFTAGLLGVLIGLLLVCIQFARDCREYSLNKYTDNNGTVARETYFRSFVGTAIYGHLSIAPKHVPVPLKYSILLFTEILYFAILDKLAMTFSCSDGRLVADPSIECWTSTHTNYACLSLTLLGYYIPLCCMVSPMFDEVKEGKLTEIRPYKSFIAIMKSMLILCVLVDSTDAFAIVYIFLCVVIISGTIYGIESETLRPMNPHTVNFIRAGFYFIGIFGAIMVLAKPTYADFQMMIFSSMIAITVIAILVAAYSPIADPMKWEGEPNVIQPRVDADTNGDADDQAGEKRDPTSNEMPSTGDIVRE